MSALGSLLGTGILILEYWTTLYSESLCCSQHSLFLKQDLNMHHKLSSNSGDHPASASGAPPLPHPALSHFKNKKGWALWALTSAQLDLYSELQDSKSYIETLSQ